MARRYRSHSAEFKLKVALEAAKNERTINQIASDFEVSPTLVMEWKKHLLSEGIELFTNKRAVKVVEPQEEVSYLHQQIGKLSVQLEWLKKKQGDYPLR
jgi:transposase-like protein